MPIVNIDLNSLSLKELKELQSAVTKAVNGFDDRKRKAALSQVEEAARALGFTLSELTGTAVPRKRSPAVPKFANPANTSETWSGRGRKPRWFVAALKAGKQPEQMAI
jgi:DNA-binding protein H-NS